MFTFNCRKTRLTRILDILVSHIVDLKAKQPSETFFTIALNGKNGLNGDDLDYVIAALQKLGNDGAIEYLDLTEKKVNGIYCFSIALPEEFEVWCIEYQKHKNKMKTKNIGPSAKSSAPFPGAHWGDITIKFMKDDNVSITYGNKTIRSDYVQMGFKDNRRNQPNTQWTLLQLLAHKNGAISWTDGRASKKDARSDIAQDFGYEQDDADDKDQSKGFTVDKTPDKTKKTKEKLSKALKAFFCIQADPFFPYKEVKAYQIRIKLIPEV